MEKDLTKETYDRIAKEWHEDHKNDAWGRDGIDSFIEKVGKNAHVLDVGCAGGLKARYLVDQGLTVHGIDLSPNFIEIAQREVPEATFEAMDLRDVGKLTQTFKGIYIQAVLLHIPKNEVREVLRNILTKLEPGGYIYIAVKEEREGRPSEEIVTENDYGYDYKRFFSYFSLNEIKEHLTALGLEVVFETVTPTGSTMWIQVIGKK